MRSISQYVGVQLAKFDPDHFNGPIDVYTIKGRSCSCPSPKYPCKHVGMVQRLKDKAGAYFDDTTDEVDTVPWLESKARVHT